MQGSDIVLPLHDLMPSALLPPHWCSRFLFPPPLYIDPRPYSYSLVSFSPLVPPTSSLFCPLCVSILLFLLTLPPGTFRPQLDKRSDATIRSKFTTTANKWRNQLSKTQTIANKLIKQLGKLKTIGGKKWVKQLKDSNVDFWLLMLTFGFQC